MFRINEKGQAETVFEVLIAVILLSFVMLAGSYAMATLSNTQCSKEIDISLRDFASNIERIASTPFSSKSYLFALPNCFGPNSNVEVRSYQNPSLCSSYCPGTNGSCVLMKYNNPKDSVATIRYLCVNVSPVTLFNPEGCEVPDEYGLVTDSNYSRGSYIISSQSIRSPIMCIFRENRE